MKTLPGLEDTILRLEAYCRSRDWAGYDPYDALNSELFARTPLAKSHVARLALTQLLKRSPVNLRPLLRIQPRQNPKALALFLMAYVRRARGGDAASRATASHLATRLLELRSPGTPYWCWGYSFPWQMRDRLVPRFDPNLVCTTFAANALLDAYELGLGPEFLDPAVSAGEYLAKELYWNDGGRAGFAYPLPDIRVPIHNANFLGAALLCRLARLTGEKAALDAALARCPVLGGPASATTGRGPTATGRSSSGSTISIRASISVPCSRSARNSAPTSSSPCSEKGFAFYAEHFFTAGGAPKYFHNRTYPIDIHCVAQSLITLRAFRDHDARADALAKSVLAWAHGAHVGRRRFLLLPRAARPDHPHAVHALVAGVDAAGAGRMYGPES